MKRISIIIFSILFFTLYIYCALRHSTVVNISKDSSDQAAYMRYAKNLREGGLRYVGTRNRMPLYPSIQSLFYRSDMTSDDFFEVGKKVNIGLSVLILVVLSIFFMKSLPLFLAVNLQLISMFTLFVFKAGYFQAELLFYFLNFMGFILMCRMFMAPRLWMGVLGGLMLGLAYLTKASVTPGLALFLIFQTAGLIWLKFKNYQTHNSRHSIRPGAIGIFILAFFITIYPYIKTTESMFGHYFFNKNSTFYMWYDSWEEVKKDNRVHNLDLTWPNVSPNEIPSMENYFAKHSPGEVFDRVVGGAKDTIFMARNSFGFFKYALAYFIFIMVMIIKNIKYFSFFFRKNIYLALFVISYFFSYLILYSFYFPIGHGLRFVLSLFLPFMFTSSWMAASVPMNNRIRTTTDSNFSLLTLFNTSISIMLAWDIYVVANFKIFIIHGGS